MTCSRWVRGPAPVLVLVIAAAVAGALDGSLTDLVVYQYGGRTLLGLPTPETSDPATTLPFTYPPFAAVMMVPLALLPTWLAAALWTGASVGVLAAVVVLLRRALDQLLQSRSRST